MIKVGLTDLPPLSFAAARFLLGSLLLFAVCLARGIRVPAPQWVDYGFLALTGILTFTINYG
ncbi:MAG: EamA family transporter, partial [Verrucomicrobiota bacterium]|nr:EamA family transporter [Verrucomicrobiota bacterium]